MPREQADAPVHGAQGQAQLVVPAARWERRGVLGAGMVGACALGAAVGILARPHDVDERARMTADRASLPERSETHLQIVVGPPPAPPLEAPLRIAASAEPVRVLAPAPPQAIVARGPVAVAVREPEPAAPPKVVKPPPAHVAQVEAAVKAVAARTKAAPKVGADRSKPSKAELAKAGHDKAAKARLAWLAKVERIKAAERENAAKAELAKAEKAKAARTVKLAAAPPTPAKAPMVQKLKAAARPAAVNAPASTLDIQLAALRAEPLKVSAPVQKAAPAPPRPAAPAPKACAAESRAEALLCGDPKLAAADRRLAAAYRRAVQAGASPDRLRRQQGRWLAARETAAEEAPWAVAQVYEARISELEDEAAQARADD